MGFFNKYPYTDFHELNLDWVLQTVKLMGEKVDNFINLNSIKYADPLAWNITTQYAANTVVIDPATGIAYLSTQAVPSGVVITDQDYWTAIFDLSAFFDDIGDLDDLLTTDRSSIVNAINEIFTHIEQLDYYVTPEMFGAIGDGVTDDTDAIQNALDYGHNNNKKVVFYPKTYAVTKTLMIYSEMNIEGNDAIIDAITPLPLPAGAIGYGVFTNTTTDDLHDFTMRNMTIKVNRNTQHGIYCYHSNGMHNLTFDGITVYNPTYDGILCHGAVYAYDDSQAYLDTVTSLKHYRVNNCTFINENTDEQTRTGLMVENSHDVVVSNCYAKGFHTGFHCEGTNDATFISCIGVDNNNDFQRTDSDYHGDFMIGRSENITMISCTARRIYHDYSFNYPGIGTRTYRTLYMPNYFMKNFKAIGCSFVQGDIYSDETGATLDKSKLSIGFTDCIFNSSSITFVRSTNDTFYRGINIDGCTFENAFLTLNYVHEFSITNNAFYNTGSNGHDMDLAGCTNGIISNNKMIDGFLDSGSYWLTGQVKLSSCSDLKFDSNVFVITGNTAKPSIGFNACPRLNIINNTVESEPIYYSIWADDTSDYSIVKNNVFNYNSPDAGHKGIRATIYTGTNSIVDDNLTITL